MVNEKVPELLKAKLRELAAKECWSDDPDFAIDDYAGGNIDDAYYGGNHSGRTELAREILEWIDTIQ